MREEAAREEAAREAAEQAQLAKLEGPAAAAAAARLARPANSLAVRGVLLMRRARSFPATAPQSGGRNACLARSAISLAVPSTAWSSLSREPGD